MLKRERQWIWDGFHQAMAEMMVLGRNPGERVALRRLEEDKWQGWSARGGRSALVAEIFCHTRSEREGTKPPYVCPGCSNHTHGNNMINRCNVINKRVIFLT
jgi:hypothetical protein